MKTGINKTAIPAICLFGLTAALAGCDNAKESKTLSVVVATSADPRPFTYFDKESNQLAGYDIDVVRAVFKHLPQYQASFVTTEFPSILAGLDAGRYQVGANNFVQNAQRKEKYLFTTPIFANQFAIAVRADNDAIHSFSDLPGKSTEVSPGVNFTTALEKYNQQHADKPIDLRYTEAELLPILQNLENGKTDFNLIDRSMVEQYIRQYHLKLKVIPLSRQDSEIIGSPFSYLLIAKGPTGERLVGDINGVLKTLAADGTLSKISEQYFHGDYAPKAQ